MSERNERRWRQHLLPGGGGYGGGDGHVADQEGQAERQERQAEDNLRTRPPLPCQPPNHPTPQYPPNLPPPRSLARSAPTPSPARSPSPPHLPPSHKHTTRMRLIPYRSIQSVRRRRRRLRGGTKFGKVTGTRQQQAPCRWAAWPRRWRNLSGDVTGSCGDWYAREMGHGCIGVGDCES